VINNQGQVMGSSNLPGDQVMHAFFWERGTLTDLGNFGGNIVEPFWLNNIGEVVGTAEYPGNTIRHGFLWKKGVITDLGTLYPRCTSSVTGSVALQVNSKTQIVGNSWCDNTAAAGFLWENGGPMVDLNSLIPPNSSMQLLGAQNINERGEITGSGILPNGDVHVFLLIPCGENHGDSECEDEGEGAAVTRGETSRRPNIVLPENVRKLLRQRLGSRFHIPGIVASPRD
jgi:probable HAF family extracellular repeat protein